MCPHCFLCLELLPTSCAPENSYVYLKTQHTHGLTLKVFPDFLGACLCLHQVQGTGLTPSLPQRAFVKTNIREQPDLHWIQRASRGGPPEEGLQQLGSGPHKEGLGVFYKGRRKEGSVAGGHFHIPGAKHRVAVGSPEDGP